MQALRGFYAGIEGIGMCCVVPIDLVCDVGRQWCLTLSVYAKVGDM